MTMSLIGTPLYFMNVSVEYELKIINKVIKCNIESVLRLIIHPGKT